MLVRFESDVGSFTSLGDVAVQLLRMAGHSGSVPGAILGDDVPAALERLESALAGVPDERAGDDEDDEPEVGLRQRAFPLLEMMRDAVKNDSAVRWRRA